MHTSVRTRSALLLILPARSHEPPPHPHHHPLFASSSCGVGPRTTNLLHPPIHAITEVLRSCRRAVTGVPLAVMGCLMHASRRELAVQRPAVAGAAPRRAGATCQCAAVTASDRHCYAAATACQGRAASKQGGCQAMRVVATRPLHRALPPPRQFVPQPACTSMHAGGGVSLPLVGHALAQHEAEPRLSRPPMPCARVAAGGWSDCRGVWRHSRQRARTMAALTSQFCGQSLQRSAVAPAMQQSAAAREWWRGAGGDAWRWRRLAGSSPAHWFVRPAPPPCRHAAAVQRAGSRHDPPRVH